MIVAVFGSVGVPRSGCSRFWLLQTTKRRLMMIVSPTPPSTTITRVLVEDDPLSVPVLISPALFDADDNDDALLPDSPLRRLLPLCDEVAARSIVELESRPPPPSMALT